MLPLTIRGKAHVYGDNINTDLIIPGKYTKTLDMQSLAAHVLEDLDVKFSQSVRSGDILVAGDNFGCGSSREQAPLALKSAGVAAVVARYFARIFYRNAINIGLPVGEVAEYDIISGDELLVDLQAGLVANLSRQIDFKISKMPPILVGILAASGLVNYLKKNSNYKI